MGEPLYPHVPKQRKKKGTNAWRCKKCGYTTWNVIHCPICNSTDLEQLTSEEVASFYQTGKPLIHPRTEPEFEFPEFTEKISPPDRDLAKIVVQAMSAEQWTKIAERLGEPYPATEERKFYLWYKLIGYK